MENSSIIGVSCAKGTVGNTGVVACVPDLNKVDALIYLKKGTKISPSNVATFKTYMTALCKNNDADLRAYPVQKFEGLERVNTDPTITETPYKTKRYGGAGTYGMKFEYRDGAMSLHKALSSFTNKQGLYDVLLVQSEDQQIYGRFDSAGNIMGYSLSMILEHLIEVGGAEDTRYLHEIQFANSREIDLDYAVMSFDGVDINVLDFKGLMQLTARPFTVNTAGVFKVQVYLGDKNAYDTYGALLAGLTYTVTNSVTGNAITVTSVVVDAGTKSLTFTVSTADADYIALPTGANMIIESPTVSVLEAAGIIGCSDFKFVIAK